VYEEIASTCKIQKLPCFGHDTGMDVADEKPMHLSFCVDFKFVDMEGHIARVKRNIVLGLVERLDDKGWHDFCTLISWWTFVLVPEVPSLNSSFCSFLPGPRGVAQQHLD